MAKRFFDIIFALFTLILFFWVVLISWLLAVIDTQTNGIFIQERIGQYGKKFNIYKFRTIQILSSSQKTHISKIGHLLRNYKLDELPQFFNVLKGQMSVVGPRPDLPGYYDSLKGESRKIIDLKPGLTSLASIKYIKEELFLVNCEFPLVYNDTIIFPDKVQLNLEYYYNRSFWGDITIILKTIWIIFLSRKNNN